MNDGIARKHTTALGRNACCSPFVGPHSGRSTVKLRRWVHRIALYNANAFLHSSHPEPVRDMSAPWPTRPSTQQLTATVVICTRNRPEHLNQCLAAVSQLRYSHFEVLVVDNAPADEQAHIVAKRWNAGYVVESAVGLSRARNRGAAHARTDFIAYLDDDAAPDPYWLLALADAFSQDAAIMGVAGRTCAPTFADERQFYCELIQGAGDRAQPRVYDRSTPEWFDLSNFGGIGAGMNMAFRRSAFQRWPGFDPRLGRGAVVDGSEENYAFFSLLDRGYRIAYAPDALVLHPTQRSRQEFHSRYLKDCAASVAYVAFLLAEQPRYRGAVFSYLRRAARRTGADARTATIRAVRPLVPAWRVALARLSGPLLYARLRMQDGYR